MWVTHKYVGTKCERSGCKYFISAHEQLSRKLCKIDYTR